MTTQVEQTKESTKGVVLGHFHCPRCSSNDNLAVYVKLKEDGTEYLDGSCFTPDCQRYWSEKALQEAGVLEEGFVIPKVKHTTKEPITKAEYLELTARCSNDTTMADGSLYRGIRTETAAFYGHLYERNANGEIIKTYYPETKHDFRGECNTLRGYKTRVLPKVFGMGNIGITGLSSDFSGQHKFPNGGKKVLIVGGEEDKLAAAQMLRDYQIQKGQQEYDRYAVVSTTSGEGSLARQCSAQYDWLNKFDEIILCMDNDPAGQKAVEKAIQEALKVLPEGKISVMKTSLNDPNKMLLAKKQKQFISNFFDAKPLVATGIVSFGDAAKNIKEFLLAPKIEFPPMLHRLNEASRGGIRSTGAIVNIIADTSIGKCLGKDTPILMYDFSQKFVQDVVVGDLLMGDDGTPRKVLSLARGTEQMYKVQQERGMSYTVNESHILSLRAGFKTGEYAKGEIVNLNMKAYLQLGAKAKRALKGYKGDFTNYAFSNKEDDHAYLLGLWLAEGCSVHPLITIHDEMYPTLLEVATRLGYTLTVKPETGNCTSYYIKGGFKNYLREVGVLGNKHFPKHLLHCSPETRYNAIAGYLDGDGYKVSNGFEVLAKYDALAESFMQLCQSVSLLVTNRKVEKSCQNSFTGVYNRMFVFGKTQNIPNRLDRKKVTEKSELRMNNNTAITVTALGVDEYYGFSIDGNRLFCLADGTVTHNTLVSDVLQLWWGFNSPLKATTLSIERTQEEFVVDMLSNHVKKNLTWIDPEKAVEYLDTEEGIQMINDLSYDEYGQPRFYIIDDRTGDLDSLKGQIERAWKMLGSRLFILDPLSDVLRQLPNDVQEGFMLWEKQMKKEGLVFINILHTRKPAPDKEGKVRPVTEYDALGSGSFVQSADINLVLNRDKMAKDTHERNTMTVEAPKLRGGTTGHICDLYYDPKTRQQYDKLDFFANQEGEF